MNSCAVCGRSPTEVHHLFGGTANRRISDRMGFTIHLCHDHHQGTRGVHGRDGAGLSLQLKQEAQRKWEQDNSRQSFMDLIGRNYL